MNKQEVIQKINDSMFSSRIIPLTYQSECFNQGMDTALKIISKLDEPQKVKVSECVGKDLDVFTKARLKEDLVKDICLAVYDYSQGVPFDAATVNWCRKGSNLRTMIDAIWNGYEVEEEPKWKIINDQKYCLTSIEAGYGNSLHWAFDSTKKKPILFDNEETALYTAYITGGTVEKVQV